MASPPLGGQFIDIDGNPIIEVSISSSAGDDFPVAIHTFRLGVVLQSFRATPAGKGGNQKKYSDWENDNQTFHTAILNPNSSDVIIH